MWAGNIDRVPRSKVSAWAQQLIKRFGIKAESPVVQLSKLSGGNQQKVVVSRNMDRDLSVIVAHNPTRGLDALAAKNVHDGLRELSLRGVGVVLISTDRDELGQLSDRTLYMGKGTLFQTEAEALGI
jgi:ribose transport system ATP-binding protein